MTDTLKIISIGSSSGVILPKELLGKLRAEKGDMLHVTEVPGGVMLRSYDPEFARKMQIAEDIMREDRDVLRKLAE